MDLEKKKTNEVTSNKNRKIYARNTVVKEIDSLEAQDFIAKNHRQGKVNDKIKKISFGLFTKIDDELVGVVQFCAPRTSAKKRKYTNELLRLSFKKGITVVGGASKLIKFYINNYSPDDFFTYQDTTGKNTRVYENSGMSFVSQGKFKKYLVKDGLTISTARFGKKEIFTLAEATRRGPDALLGVKLGEVYNSDGSRKTNIDLFCDLGWHIETTSGDKIYEWVNRNKTYYTYKITSSDSDKYYYGVSHIKKGNATIDDCLNDGYYGSGGVKFQNWKEKHQKKISKEVLKTFSRKQDAYKSEKELVGNLWKTDPLCLNAQEGGILDVRNDAWNRQKVLVKKCKIHGLTKHIGDTCPKCLSERVISVKVCELHGETKHIGDSCFKCSYAKTVSIKECAVHGMTKHVGNNCAKCLYANNAKMKKCIKHGRTNHIGNSCLKCSSDSAFSEKFCEIHGLTKHVGNACSKCFSEKSMNVKECPVHGLTKHKGDCCTKCKNQKNVTVKDCSVHGKVKHQGNTCTVCVSEKQISLKECPVHGKTKFRGSKCYKCSTGNSVIIKECSVHGLTKYQGDNCKKCVSQKRVDIQECSVHGLTKHQDNKCSKCSAKRNIFIKDCSIHGATKHRGNSCIKCSNGKSIVKKDCHVHGFCNHTGVRCKKCMAHKRNHNAGKHTTTNSLCPVCIEELKNN